MFVGAAEVLYKLRNMLCYVEMDGASLRCNLWGCYIYSNLSPAVARAFTLTGNIKSHDRTVNLIFSSVVGGDLESLSGF